MVRGGGERHGRDAQARPQTQVTGPRVMLNDGMGPGAAIPLPPQRAGPGTRLVGGAAAARGS